nr:MAG TPA: hypothetical protein [Caudoviricetes sp.]
MHKHFRINTYSARLRQLIAIILLNCLDRQILNLLL